MPDPNPLHGSRPNIIFILSDDVSYRDFSCLGQQHFRTPHIDRICHEGVHFTQAYAGSPECAPSRASLITGMHMGHCTVRCNGSVRGQEHLLASDVTVADVLKQAGYATGFVGKWGIGLPGTEGVPHRKGFDFAYGFYDQGRAHTYYPDYLWENDQQIILRENHGFDMARLYEYNKRPIDRLDDVPNHYDEQGRLIADGVSEPSRVNNSQDLIHAAALRFIRAHRDEPFFLYYATQLPHGPCITPSLGPFKDKPWSLKHREWASMIKHMDDHVGEVMGVVEELGLSERTIVLFAGDNGYSAWGYFGRRPYEDDPLLRNKGPWRGGKFIALEGGLRVPFFAHWPGQITPGTSQHVCALYDFLATAADLAGAEITHEQDGISLLDALTGREAHQTQHEYLYWENGTHAREAQAARYREWHAWRHDPSQPIELYRVEEDPQLERNLASDHPEVVSQIERIFDEAHSDSAWYINPGESKASRQAKLDRVEREGSWQRSTRPNTTYGRNGTDPHSRAGVSVPTELD